MFFKWDLGKQYSLTLDATEQGVPYGTILFSKRNFIEKLKFKKKNIPDVRINYSGLTQVIIMGKFIRHIWIYKLILRRFRVTSMPTYDFTLDTALPLKLIKENSLILLNMFSNQERTTKGTIKYCLSLFFKYWLSLFTGI